ncbi:PEGA domain-containing protein [Sorangium sp. So ce1389]|uniref:PEGA domain-containing protein n=1 Tax=Sorangium sp. So ce1389 TaxID=3133336 RepID=UPI003F5EE4F7
MRRRRVALALIAPVALGALLPRRALGAPQEEPSLDGQEATDARRSEAIARYRKGRTLYAEGAWAAALAEFLASRQLHPMWAATSSAALCLKQLRRHDEALDLFEALLREFGAEMPASAREVAQREVVALRALVGTIEIEGAEPGAAITIDGQSRGEHPALAPLRVPAGSHLVRLSKEGFEPFERRIEVAGGRTARVAARLRALARSGRLRVAEKGGRTLDVVVDWSVVGKTPWEGRIPAGEHVVQLRGSGDLGTLPVPISIETDRTTPLTLEAEELAAVLWVEPEPRNARVAIDGLAVGHGHWAGRVRAGAHRIEVAAPGFVPEVRRLDVGRGERQVLRVQLGRDEASPFWRRPARPARIVVELGTTLLLVPTLGGDLAAQCTQDCRLELGTGAGAAVHAGYDLGAGLGFGVAVGYVAATPAIAGRRASLTPVGLAANPGTADDRLALRGGLAGAWVGLTVGERLPLHLRLGAGALLGTVLDTRTGEFRASDERVYRLDPVMERRDVAFFHLTPEVRAGLPLGRGVQLTAGVAVPVLFSLWQPRWAATHEVRAGSDGFGTFGDDTLVGAVLVAFAPGIGARYDF